MSKSKGPEGTYLDLPMYFLFSAASSSKAASIVPRHISSLRLCLHFILCCFTKGQTQPLTLCMRTHGRKGLLCTLRCIARHDIILNRARTMIGVRKIMLGEQARHDARTIASKANTGASYPCSYWLLPIIADLRQFRI